MTIETRRVCVLSMARLSESTLMDMRNGEGSMMLTGALGPDMAIAHCPSERNEFMPDDLANVLAWAHGNGWEYVIFDRDVDPEEDGSGLPRYDAPEGAA